MAAFMANKGSLDGEQLMSQRTWEAAHAEASYQVMVESCAGSFFTQGGFSYFDYDAVKKEKGNPYWTDKFTDSY